MKTPLKTNKPVATEKIELEILMNQSVLHLLDFSRCRNFDARIKKIDLAQQMYTTFVEFPNLIFFRKKSIFKLQLWRTTRMNIELNEF